MVDLKKQVHIFEVYSKFDGFKSISNFLKPSEYRYIKSRVNNNIEITNCLFSKISCLIISNYIHDIRMEIIKDDDEWYYGTFYYTNKYTQGNWYKFDGLDGVVQCLNTLND